MPGPLPIPTAMNAARGFPGHRPKNPDEPASLKLASLDPPAYLPLPARLIWEELAPEADRAGTLDRLGVRLFATACRLQALGEAQLDKAERRPRAKPGPSWWAAIKLLDKAAGFWARFGLDPASRTRLRVEPPDDRGDELAAFRKAHPPRRA